MGDVEKWVGAVMGGSRISKRSRMDDENLC